MGKRFFCLVLTLTMVVSASFCLGVSASTTGTITKSGNGVEITGADTFTLGEDVTINFSKPVSSGCIEVEGVGTLPLNVNTGEGRQKNSFIHKEAFEQIGETSYAHKSEAVYDLDSPVSGAVEYRHKLSKAVNKGGSTFVGVGDAMIGGPSVISLGMWVKSDNYATGGAFGSIYGYNVYLHNASNGRRIEFDIPLKDLAANIGNETAITATTTAAFNAVCSSYSVTAKCVEQNNGWGFFVANIKNIVWDANYVLATNSSGIKNTRFYEKFDNNKYAMAVNGKTVDLANFTLLMGQEVDNPYVIYPTAGDTSFNIAIPKGATSVTVPAKYAIGNLKVTAYAGGTSNSSISALSSSAYDLNVANANHKNISFTMTANGNNLRGISIDGNALDPNSDYTVAGNVCTLLSFALDDLKTGNHTVAAVFDGGVSPTASFTVADTRDKTKELYFALDGDVLMARSDFGDSQYLYHKLKGITETSVDANISVDFGDTRTMNKTALTDENIWNTSFGTRMGYGDDCRAPFSYNNSFIGAGHGHARALTITVPNHGKDVTDIGSLWNDASNTKWTLLKVKDADTLVFLSENIGESSSKYNFKGNITWPMTYVSSGEHTASITSGTQVSNTTYVAPALGNIVRKVFANIDGQRIEISGKAYVYADSLEIEESYNIINPATVGDALRANRPAGGYTTMPSLAVGETMVSQNMVYKIENDGTFLAVMDHEIMDDVNFGKYGGIQYTPRSDAYNGGVYLYIPKTNGTGLYDFSQKFKLSNLSQAVEGSSALWENENDVPDRMIDYYNTNATTSRALCAFGYLPIGDGAKEVRAEKNISSFYFSPQKKHYPAFVSYPVGTSTKNMKIQGVAYTKYQDLLPEEGTGSTYTVSYGDDLYVYMDYLAADMPASETTADTYTIPAEYADKTVSLVEKTDNITYSVDGSTVNINVANRALENGYLVLKLGETNLDLSVKEYNATSKIATVKYQNGDSAAADVRAIIAAYDGSGRLIGVKGAAGTSVPGSGEATITLNLAAFDDVARVELFIRDVNSIVVPISRFTLYTK